MIKFISVIFGFLFLILTRAQFWPERLRITDSNPERNTFLVRGNLPIDKHQKFQIQELRGNLSTLTGLNRYRLVVVSLINTLTPKETKNKYIEDKFFLNNKKIADYHTWTILGSPINPTVLPSWAAKFLNFLGSIFDFDKVDVLVQQFHDSLHLKGRNLIIYVHCSAGVDRTGYVAGSYRMKYKGLSLREVHSENIEVLKGLRNYMHFNAKNGMQWFCLSLGRTQSQCTLP